MAQWLLGVHSRIPVRFRLWILLLLVVTCLHGFSALPCGLTPLGQAEAQVGGAAVVISSPRAGSVINEFTVLVRGTLVVAPATEVGVTVNGVRGLVDAGQFAAIVLVDAQVTNLTATARDANGTVLGSDTVAVTVQTPTSEPILLFRPSPMMGMAPLTAKFTLTSLKAIALVTLDADGNGTPDFVGTSLDGKTFTYNGPGLYFPKVTVVDTANNTYTETSVVQAFAQITLDSLLRSKWTAMKNALRSNDVERALKYIVISKRSAYRRMFNALIVPLSGIDQVLPDIGFVQQLDGIVEYEMQRSDGGVQFSHVVSFVVDEDGIWRIRFL